MSVPNLRHQKGSFRRNRFNSKGFLRNPIKLIFKALGISLSRRKIPSAGFLLKHFKRVLLSVWNERAIKILLGQGRFREKPKMELNFKMFAFCCPVLLFYLIRKTLKRNFWGGIKVKRNER
jgi:hypothetical protein